MQDGGARLPALQEKQSGKWCCDTTLTPEPSEQGLARQLVPAVIAFRRQLQMFLKEHLISILQSSGSREGNCF
jgi:hypothetical protein